MCRQANAAFGQQEPGLMAQLPVQPRIWLGRFRPAALIEAAQDNQIGTLHTGLQRAPDHDRSIGGVAVAHLALRQDGRQKIGKIAR